MTKVAHPLRFALALLTAVAIPMPLLAQSDCHVDELSRDDDGGQRRLAVRGDTGWQFFRPSADALTHAIEVGGLQELCVAWEAPPYQRRSRQIVYVSTQYLDDNQPIWLFRNNQAAGVPFIGRLLGDWNNRADASGTDPNQAFKEFHHLSGDPDAARWKNLIDWHNTSGWLPNQASYELVRVAIDLAGLPYGTERLLMVRGRRPFASWIPFTTHAPSKQDELRVAVSYSGDLEGSGPRVYQYVFEVR